jgi:hypothetical protein
MIPTCASAVDWSTLVDYWAGELSPEQQQALEEHLFGCESCSERSASVASITESFRGMLPPVVTPELVAGLRQRGMSIVENHFSPGERKEVEFPAGVELLIHRLCGLPLEGATRVSFSLHVEGDPQRVLVAQDDVPFDRASGSVLVACQQHYASMPPDTVAELWVHGQGESPRRLQFTILHRWPG